MVEHVEHVEYVERIDCPDCGGEAEEGTPNNWLVPGEKPRYRHADGCRSSEVRVGGQAGP
jgi:hypothetical protein